MERVQAPGASAYLSSAVYFAFSRDLKGLQDSRVKRYVCPRMSLLGVMVLRLPEPNLTPFTSQGDPGVGVQGPPGPIGPLGPKVSGGGSGQGDPWRWEGEGILGPVPGRGPAGTPPPFALCVPGRRGPPRPCWCAWYCRLPWPTRPSRRDGPPGPQRRAGNAGSGTWRSGGVGTSAPCSGRGEGCPGLRGLGSRAGSFPSHLCLSCPVFLAGSGRPLRERGSPGSLGATWTARVSGE